MVEIIKARIRASSIFNVAKIFRESGVLALTATFGGASVMFATDGDLFEIDGRAATRENVEAVFRLGGANVVILAFDAPPLPAPPK